MEKGSIFGSLDRIESAIARIEAAAQDRSSPAQIAPAVTVDADLEQRHATLKIAVTQALARLDDLIGQQT
jgi:uncharacterized protein YceH (UPF0502 family)